MFLFLLGSLLLLLDALWLLAAEWRGLRHNSSLWWTTVLGCSFLWRQHTLSSSVQHPCNSPATNPHYKASNVSIETLGSFLKWCHIKGIILERILLKGSFNVLSIPNSSQRWACLQPSKTLSSSRLKWGSWPRRGIPPHTEHTAEHSQSFIVTSYFYSFL